MGSAIKWQTYGRNAARRGQPDTACPYTVAGIAWRNWIKGYRDEQREIEKEADWLRDMDDLQKSSKLTPPSSPPR